MRVQVTNITNGTIVLPFPQEKLTRGQMVELSFSDGSSAIAIKDLEILVKAQKISYTIVSEIETPKVVTVEEALPKVKSSDFSDLKAVIVRRKKDIKR